MLLCLINRTSGSILYKAFLGCIAITFVEFIVGCIVNLQFKMRVWDYSALPFNLLGQICLRFCCVWFLLSFMLFGLLKTAGLRF